MCRERSSGARLADTYRDTGPSLASGRSSRPASRETPPQVARLAAGPIVDFELSASEAAWIKRGRNAVSRRGPVRMKASVYQDASGLECLAGYLC